MRAVDVNGTTMLRLLCNCNGVFQPGVLTALVGSSGAGKTTLMDVLCGRKTGELEHLRQDKERSQEKILNFRTEERTLWLCRPCAHNLYGYAIISRKSSIVVQLKLIVTELTFYVSHCHGWIPAPYYGGTPVDSTEDPATPGLKHLHHLSLRKWAAGWLTPIHQLWSSQVGRSQAKWWLVAFPRTRPASPESWVIASKRTSMCHMWVPDDKAVFCCNLWFAHIFEKFKPPYRDISSAPASCWTKPINILGRWWDALRYGPPLWSIIVRLMHRTEGIHEASILLLKSHRGTAWICRLVSWLTSSIL